MESVTWELNTDDTDEEIIESPTVWLVPKCGTFLRNSTKRFQADVERERAEENRAIGKPSPPRLIGSVVYDNTDVAYVFDHVLNDEDRNIFERGLFERHGPPGSRLTYEEQRRFNELERHARKEKATTRSE